jgi:hypothetical protein
MKKALISPSEVRGTGYRVAWTNDVEVEHCPPMFWVDCEDSVVQDAYWYDPADSTIKVATTAAELPYSRTK